MAKMVKIGWGMHLTENLENHKKDWFQHLIQMSHSNAELKSKSNFYDLSPFFLKNGEAHDFDQDAFSFHGQLLMTSFVQTPHSDSFIQELKILDESLFPTITDHTAAKYNIGFALFEQPLADREEYDSSVLSAVFYIQDADNPLYQELFAYPSAEGMIAQLLQTLNSNFVEMPKLFELVKQHTEHDLALSKLLPKTELNSLSDQYTAFTAFLVNSRLGLPVGSSNHDICKTRSVKNGERTYISTKMLAFGVEINIEYLLQKKAAKIGFEDCKISLTAVQHQSSDGVKYINKAKLKEMINSEKLFKFLRKYS